MNRKGHIPTIILFIGGLVLVVVTLYVLVRADNSFGRQSGAYSLVLQISEKNGIDAQHALSADVLETLARLEDNGKSIEIGFKSEFQQVVAKNRASVFRDAVIAGKFSFDILGEGVFVIIIPNLQLRSEYQHNEISRILDLEQKFNLEGLIYSVQ